LIHFIERTQNVGISNDEGRFVFEYNGTVPSLCLFGGMELELVERRLGKSRFIKDCEDGFAVILTTTDPGFDVSLLPKHGDVSGVKIRFTCNSIEVVTSVPPSPVEEFVKQNIEGAGIECTRSFVKWMDKLIGGFKPVEWTLREQVLLEAVLEESIGMEKHARWRMISHAIPNKTKRDIIVRFLKIAKLVKPQRSPAEPLDVWSSTQQKALDHTRKVPLDSSQGAKMESNWESCARKEC